MYNTIAEEEFERFLDAVENNEINPRMRFCDYADFEDEYSHNEINKSHPIFLTRVIEHIWNVQLTNCRAKYGVDCVFVEKLS